MSAESSKSIWFNPEMDLTSFSDLGKGNMAEWLGLSFTEVGPDFLKGTIPVDHRTRQPYGLLHGGASVVLAETLGSISSAMVIDHSKYLCVGLEVNANHLRPAREGFVTGICKPIHLGATTHVWDIRLYDERGRITCICRLTVAILKR